MQPFDCPSGWSKKIGHYNGRVDKYTCNHSVSQISSPLFLFFLDKTLFLSPKNYRRSIFPLPTFWPPALTL